MLHKKKGHPKEKTELNPRNRHRGRYHLKELVATYAALAPFVTLNAYNDESIDFANPEAVKALNKALLLHFYDINYWEIPANYLCPPIPGRADYIHHVADLLGNNRQGNIPKGNAITCLDIGVGANCVYPIIGHHEYGWSFVGSEIDTKAFDSAVNIVEKNEHLKPFVQIRFQDNPKQKLNSIIQSGEKFDVSICNPPFHLSLKDAQEGSIRKVSNLNQKKVSNPVLNFGGQSNELWCFGGEAKFISDLIVESKTYAKSCLWFTTLVSKQIHLEAIYHQLNEAEAFDVKTIRMGQGNKISRIVAWTFQNLQEQKDWVKERWN